MPIHYSRGRHSVFAYIEMVEELQMLLMPSSGLRTPGTGYRTTKRSTPSKATRSENAEITPRQWCASLNRPMFSMYDEPVTILPTRRRPTHFALISMVLTAVLLSGSIGSAFGEDIFTNIVGEWGWTGSESETCRTNPHRISVLGDNDYVVLEFRAAVPSSAGGHERVFHYRVLEYQATSITMEMQGEVRTDDKGNLVTWRVDLSSDKNKYTWVRSDWTEGQGTSAVERCTAVTENSGSHQPYVPIIKVQPNYPRDALVQGIEGWCIVQFRYYAERHNR